MVRLLRYKVKQNTIHNYMGVDGVFVKGAYITPEQYKSIKGVYKERVKTEEYDFPEGEVESMLRQGFFKPKDIKESKGQEDAKSPETLTEDDIENLSREELEDWYKEIEGKAPPSHMKDESLRKKLMQNINTN